jgi:hypothetical protein
MTSMVQFEVVQRLTSEGWGDPSAATVDSEIGGPVYLTRWGDLVRVQADGSVEVAYWGRAAFPEELSAITKRLSERWSFAPAEIPAADPPEADGPTCGLDGCP